MLIGLGGSLILAALMGVYYGKKNAKDRAKAQEIPTKASAAVGL